MRRFLVGLLVLVAAVGGAAYVFRAEIALAVMQRTLDANFAGDPLAAMPDGLHIALCGAGSPMPDAARSGPCVAIVAGKRLIVIDTGSGASRTLSRMRLPPAQVERILLTHFHSDHIDGLGELMLQRWAGGGTQAPVPVHGPEGVQNVVDGFNAAYTLDKGYRVAHHGPAVVPPAGFGGAAVPFAVAATGETTVLDDGGLKITAFAVDHAPIEPAVGYKIYYKGRTAVISGDTKVSANVEAAAAGVDLLVHEALSPKLVAMIGDAAKKSGRTNIEQIMHDIVDYHTSPEEAAGIAARAKVRALLLYHIVPPLPVGALEGPFLGRAREIFSGPLQVGRDGDVVSLPAGSAEVAFGNRL